MVRQGALRERKKQQARSDLIWAAVELFREQGYEATTVEQIVERADYSRSTFFRNFGSKEDVVFGDLPRLKVAFHARLMSRRPDEDPWAVAREAMSEQVLTFTTEAPELEIECVKLYTTEPALRRRYAEIAGEWETIASQFLESAWGPAAKLEAQVAAIALIGVARVVVEELVSDPATIERHLEAGFGLLERGTSTGGAQRPRRRPA